MQSSFKKNQIRLGTLFGIPLTFDYSWFLVLFFLTWILAGSYFPSEYKDWSHVYYWIVGAATSVLFVLSVLFHEMGHSIAAKKYKYKVDGIKLFIFGGISEIKEEPRKPIEELFISAAGPAVTFILALIFYILSFISKGNQYLFALFHYLYSINLILGVFNVLPGFPLDGGRILRALIWKKNNDFTKATNTAAGIGRIFGFIIVMFGFFAIMSGNLIEGVWLSFIGWFLESAAFAQVQKEKITKYFEGHTVEEAMSKAYGIVPSNTTISEFINNDLLIRHRRAFIVEENGANIGLLTIHDVENIPKQQWETTAVKSIMKPLNKVETVTIDFSLFEALKKMDYNGVNQLPVVEDGKIVGMLNRESIISFLMDIESQSK